MNHLELYTSKTCAPCRSVKSFFNEIEGCQKTTYDLDEHRSYFLEYNVRAVPTFIYRNEGGLVLFRHTGYLSKEELLKKIDAAKSV